MSEENAAENTGGESTGGDTSGQNTGGNATEGGGAGFTFDRWNGSRDNLPEEHQASYDAFHKHAQIQSDTKNQELLADTLNRRYSEQDTIRRNAQARIDSRGSSDGSEESPLTASQLNAEFTKREFQRKRSERVQTFRESMIDIVGKPQQYGDATVTFASNDEVTAFETWMDGMFKGKMTPHDMLKIYRFDQILKANSDSAVRNFEKGLKGRKISVTEGGGSNDLPRSNKSNRADTGGSGRIASLEDFIKSENPGAHAEIIKGTINPLEHI